MAALYVITDNGMKRKGKVGEDIIARIEI